jgi:ribonuclease P protein component
MSDEAHLPAEQSRAQAATRLPGPQGDRGGPQGPGGASRPRPQAAVGLNSGSTLGKLRRRADFLAANRGLRASTPGFVLLVRQRKDGDPAMRLGITVTKKVGGAVTRNRIKRRFRALAAEILPANGFAGADHVLIGRAEAFDRSFDVLSADLKQALAKVRK